MFLGLFIEDSENVAPPQKNIGLPSSVPRPVTDKVELFVAIMVPAVQIRCNLSYR